MSIHFLIVCAVKLFPVGLVCADFGLLVFNGLNCDVNESRELSVVLSGS